MKEESRIVEETRQKIASGELTYDQMKEKLIAAIDKEYEKEGEPNIELINACEELLAELATDGQPLPESNQEKYGEVVRQNIQVTHHARNRVGFFKRLAVSFVVLVLLLGGGQAFLHREWFEHGTTLDEQQHTVQGFVVDPGLVAKAIAEASSTSLFSSKNYEEIREFLGFDLPSAIFLHGWDVDLFFVEIQPFYIKVTVKYINKEEKISATVQLSMYKDANNAYASFEQNFNGTKEFMGKVKIYRSSNQEDTIVSWIEDNCCWYCFGNITDDQLDSIVKQIIGGI